MDRKQVLESAKEANVKYIRLCFTDIHGLIKNVEIPVRKLEDALNNEIMIDGSSIEGFTRLQESDMYLYPDVKTWLIHTWENSVYGNVASLVCDVYTPDGKPFIGDPRYVLKQNLKKMKAMGFEKFNIGVEPEFFLFKKNNGSITMEVNDTGGYFDLSPIDGAEDCRRDIVLELERLGFNMEASHHEVAPGQHEINFEFEDALEACDKLQTFKLVVKNVAKRHGYHASFMPKPLANVNGSGMHTNCSLSTKDGENAFYDKESSLGLSDVCRHWIAGIMEHARAFTAITNPTVNSYKRLVPGYEAPCYVSWSDINRSTMIRIPASRGRQTRTEIRSVDPSANPYLAMSVILASGLDGIARKLDPVDPVYINLYELNRESREEMGILNLPENLKDAMKALKKDEVIKEALGNHVLEKFFVEKEKEWDRFRMSITQWELDTYLKAL